MGNSIPCGEIDDAGYRKPENGLELPDCIGGCRAIDPVSPDAGDSSIDRCNCIKLLLNLADLISAGADGQVIAGPGRGNSGDLFGGVDIHIASVIMPQYFYGGVALFSKVTAPPLRQPNARNVYTQKSLILQGFCRWSKIEINIYIHFILVKNNFLNDTFYSFALFESVSIGG